LLTGHLDHVLLEQTRPVELLPALNHLVIKTEVVFIKPLFRMSLIDRENTVLSLLS
jgi:hypothetical protein